MRRMKVVYTARHLGHDVTHETYLGQAIPANEVAERAQRIRDELVADGGFELVDPVEHGIEPIVAIHDPGLVRFVEEAWPQSERERIDRTFLVADTYPVRAMFEGMSDAALTRLREPRADRRPDRLVGPGLEQPARGRDLRRGSLGRRRRADDRGPGPRRR